MKLPEKPNVLSFSRHLSKVDLLSEGTSAGLADLAPVLSEFKSSRDAQSDVRNLEEQVVSVEMVAVEDISFGRFQPRILTNENDLEELSSSIRAQGMLQPILVRKLNQESSEEASYEIIAGERRLRAARLAGLVRVPAIVKTCLDVEALEIAIVENAQREDLNPIEEALAYQRLANEFGLTQKEIADKVGKNRSTVANSLRLLQLDSEVLELVKNNQLSAGHGRALLMLEDSHEQKRFAAIAIHSGLSVHALEKLIQKELERSSEEVEDEMTEEDLRVLKKQSAKVAEYLGIDKADLKIDSSGQKKLSLVFPTEASWKRFVAKIK